MSLPHCILSILLLVLAYYSSLVKTEQSIESIITGYGYASSSNTLSTGAQGSEHSATYSDPGDCATNINVYPIGTLIYVVGLQKYFSVQDVCTACSSASPTPHFDLWMGLPSYSNATQLGLCAGLITVSSPTATVIINPNDDYTVDSTPLMSGAGICDTDAEYSRTQPGLAGGSSTGGNGNSKGNGSSTTTLNTAVSSASASAGSVRSAKNHGSSGHCGWKGHCRGAACGGDDDCADPLACVSGVCT